MENPIKEKQTDTQSKVTPVNGKNLVRENPVKGHPSGGKKIQRKETQSRESEWKPSQGRL